MGRVISLLNLLIAFSHFHVNPVAANPSGFVSGKWQLVQEGTTGVSAMQLAVVSETKVIIFDKVENNPLTVNGHPAWASEVDLPSRTVRPLNPTSNTFCATGSFLSNGTLIHSGGDPFNVDIGSPYDNGVQSLRLFTPCDDGTCDIIEDVQRRRLSSPRWYPSSTRLEDGSILILGGSLTGPQFINNASNNNPTYEFFPPKNINGFNGLSIPSQFLKETIRANGFPNLHTLPDGRLLIGANQQTMLFDWKTNTETRLPNIPNGVIFSYPFSAGVVLLPLTPANNYTPEILICGGAAIDDSLPDIEYSSQSPTSNQCARLVLTEAGIAAGWKVESMPGPKTMLDAILLPDGRVLLVNGAETGVSGFASASDQIGESNADHPVLTPVVYDPNAPAGKRFSSEGIPASTIPRMYHSTASLVPDGTILIAGSNPNTDVAENVTFPTEYRMEFLSPPYMSQDRPTFTGLPATVDFGKTFMLNVTLPPKASGVTVSLMDLGFSTHGVHMDQKLIQLKSTLSRNNKTLSVTAPSNARLYSPGPAFIFIVTNEGVPSVSQRTIIGTNASPPVDQGAIDNLLNHTTPPSP